MKYRKIQKTVTGRNTVDGAGVHLVRVIGYPDVKEFDPFLMLDAFDSTDPRDYVKGFPWHPHRGIETVTYLLKGDIEHGDSLGNKGNILDGGCQWMTAGSGIIHQEMPQEAERMLGLQLWLNLPAKDKMTNPKYRDLTAEKIPAILENGIRVSIIAGEYKDSKGAMKGDFVDATMLDITLDAGCSCVIPVPQKHTVFAYIIDGKISFDGTTNPEENKKRIFQDRRHAVLLSDGDGVSLASPPDSTARCILFSGPPLGESIAWGGPIVMNTQEELDLAFSELDKGTFIK